MAVPFVSGHTNSSQPSRIGLLTRTIIKSPVVKWILPARIRHRRLNDVVFVGDDFVRVKIVRRGGYVEHVSSKHDFGSRICSAAVFTMVDPSSPDEHQILYPNQEADPAALPSPILPAQLLVLILESHTLMFLYLAAQGNGAFTFRHQVLPLPIWPDTGNNIGVHIAIDPHSRAMVVASQGGYFMVYSAKNKQEFRGELASGHENWCPVVEERQINDPAVIQHVTFLYPQRVDIDHVILLLVLVNPQSGRTSLKYFDWRVGAGFRNQQEHKALPIDAPKCVPSLLIPLCNTNFILVYGRSINIYKDLLSGTPRVLSDSTIDSAYPSAYPGNSPKFPLWVNWCRPMRSPSALQDRDSLYLCREDGKVFHLCVYQIGNTHASFAGDLECHVGEAFASLGDDISPDLLAVAADMSTGRIVSIGNWPSSRMNSRSRQETMGMKLVEFLPNWASITDMVVTKISSAHGRSGRERDSIFISSGRQPYGTITEIRKGLEARLLKYLPLPGSSDMLDVWALPDVSTASVILLLSTPESTAIYQIAGGENDIETTCASGVFETAARTLAAGITKSNQLIQITEKQIIVAGSMNASFEDVQKKLLDACWSIVCATIEPNLNLIICSEKAAGQYAISTYTCHADSSNDDALIQTGPRTSYGSQPLCIASALLQDDDAVVLVANEKGLISVLGYSDEKIATMGSFSLSAEGEEDLPCDQMVLLRKDESHYLVVCSLRDGTLLTLLLSISSASTEEAFRSTFTTGQPRHSTFTATFTAGHPRRSTFGHSTVKLIRLYGEKDAAYAICGSDVCLLTVGEGDSINIQNIWTTDKERPELAQGHIFGCARFPQSDTLTAEGDLNMLGGSLVMLTANEVWITALGTTTTIVPRQFSVAGTPFRLIYAQAQRNLVCASMVTSVPESNDRRRCTPHIEFISPRGRNATTSYIMDPGEEVFSLLEWSPALGEKDKLYLFVLVGSKYLRNGVNTDIRGRISFLRQLPGDPVKLQHRVTVDAPVYSMALYDKLTFVVCYGNYVCLYRFSSETSKIQAASQPTRMGSSGVSIICAAPMIYITTMNDSLVVFRVEDAQLQGTTLPHRLVVASTAPAAEFGISHTLLPLADAGPEPSRNLALMTTRERKLVGLALPDHDAAVQSRLRTSRTVIEAVLPQSIIRVRRCNLRPSWIAEPSGDVIDGSCVGCCTDGSMVGLAVVNEKLWRRLFWLQRLCECSPEFSPHSYGMPLYAATNNDNRGESRALPIGLAGESDIILSAPDAARYKARDMHIDGDVLVRLLEHGGASTLRMILRHTAEKQDHVGEWMTEHLALEMNAVDGCIEELRVLLNSWL